MCNFFFFKDLYLKIVNFINILLKFFINVLILIINGSKVILILIINLNFECFNLFFEILNLIGLFDKDSLETCCYWWLNIKIYSLRSVILRDFRSDLIVKTLFDFVETIKIVFYNLSFIFYLLIDLFHVIRNKFFRFA